MRPQWTARTRRVLTVVGAALTAIVVFAAPALAHHRPVILDSTDVLPWQAPLIVEGTDAVGLFGDLPHAGAVRSAQFNMVAGEQIELIYSIPNQAPETNLSNAQLPVVLLFAPNGSATWLKPTMREVAGPAPYSLMFLDTYTATAVTGTYSLVVTGAAPARFVISVGPEGNHDPVELLRGEIATSAQVDDWYGIS